MALADTAQLAVKLTLDDRGFSGPLSRVQRNLKGLNTGFGRVGKGVGQLGAGFARVGAIAAGAAAVGLVAVAREGIKWESALAGVNKTMDLTPTELQGIGTEIRKLATTIPIGADAIAGLAEQAGALGIAKEDVVEFARVAATIGVTTTISADEAASALGGMATILGLTGDEFERFASSLVDLGNKGASSEDQILAIAERVAGAGATIGLTTDQMLAFSAATANIKIPPEAAGSSLQKFFIDTLKAVREGGSELDVFAKTAGLTSENFALLFKKNPSVALESFIDGLAEVGKGKRLDILEDLGFTDIRITRMLLGLAEAEKKNNNLSDSLDASQLAWAANTAAAEEADKRYKTVGSKIELLRNQAIESALLIGEGFLPALGRMSDKLKAILTDDEQRQTFIDFGKDIGAIIDGIDFNKVLGAAKTFLGAVKSIWSILRLIPIEISAAVAAFVGINKLSGGLIGAGVGNIVGGIAESVGRSLFTKIPGLGKLGALPVYVVNMGPGGLGGGIGGAAGGGVAGAAKGGLSGLSKVFLVGEAIGLAVLVKEVADNVTSAAHDQAVGIHTALTSELQTPQTNAELIAKLGAINTGINDINALGNIPAALFHDTLVELETMRTQVVNQLQLNRKGTSKNLQPLPKDITPKEEAAFGRLRDRIESNRIATVTNTAKTGEKLSAVTLATRQTKIAMMQKLDSAKMGITSGGHTDKNAIVGAIQRNRPIVNVTVNGWQTNTIIKSGLTQTQQTNVKKMQNSGYVPP